MNIAVPTIASRILCFMAVFDKDNGRQIGIWCSIA
jgi:hypothetical protein